jgi:predicted nucleic-acid-binding Zn-ribbon protein
MKNSGKCPKCGAEEIIRIPKDVGFGAASVEYISLGPLTYVYITRYMCGNCGLVEFWIDSSLDIKNVKKKFGNYKIS